MLSMTIPVRFDPVLVMKYPTRNGPKNPPRLPRALMSPIPEPTDPLLRNNGGKVQNMPTYASTDPSDIMTNRMPRRGEEKPQHPDNRSPLPPIMNGKASRPLPSTVRSQ